MIVVFAHYVFESGFVQCGPERGWQDVEREARTNNRDSQQVRSKKSKKSKNSKTSKNKNKVFLVLLCKTPS